MSSTSRADVLRRIAGYALLVTGALTVLTVLPIRLWLVLLGAACVAIGWLMVTR